MKIILLLLLFGAFSDINAQQQTMKIKLYFPNSKFDKPDCSVPVHPITRTIAKTNAVAKAALEQLFTGPTSDEKARGFYSDFSEDTKSLLISVNIRNRNAYVNLRDLTGTTSIGNFTTSCGGSNFFGQVENTLKQFSTIEKFSLRSKATPRTFTTGCRLESVRKNSGIVTLPIS
jgi:spore germination protein GerM